MSKRILVVLLILAGVLAIAGVLYWTFQPTLKERAQAPVPTPTESVGSPESAPSVQAPSTPPSAKPAAPQAPSAEEQEQQLLRNRASAFVARQGSYANSDGFIALRDVYLDVSPTVRAFYEAEQRRLTQEHPLTKGAWVQTTRSLSSKITSDTPVGGKSEATVSVQAQQAIEAGLTAATLSYREYLVTFTRNQGRWLVTRIEWNELKL